MKEIAPRVRRTSEIPNSPANLRLRHPVGILSGPNLMSTNNKRAPRLIERIPGCQPLHYKRPIAAKVGPRGNQFPSTGRVVTSTSIYSARMPIVRSSNTIRSVSSPLASFICATISSPHARLPASRLRSWDRHDTQEGDDKRSLRPKGMPIFPKDSSC
jgi:hypothetical protein